MLAFFVAADTSTALVAPQINANTVLHGCDQAFPPHAKPEDCEKLSYDLIIEDLLEWLQNSIVS